jgi:S1-C subfamily serine protease
VKSCQNTLLCVRRHRVCRSDQHGTTCDGATRQNGEVRRGRIGVVVEDLAAHAGQSDTPTEGAVVAEVASGSPAEQAGIQKGDIVTAVDGKSIRSATHLRNSVGLTPVRHRIQLTLVRNGIEKAVSVRLYL